MKNVKQAALALTGVAMIALLPGQALADKVGAAMTGVKDIDKIGHNSSDVLANCSSTYASADDLFWDCPSENSTGWQEILFVDIQTQNHAELAFDMALQCGVALDTNVASRNLLKEAAEAKADIKVRIGVIFEGETEPHYAMPGEGGVEENGVTFCSGLQRLEGTFSGGDCTVLTDPETGELTGEISCATQEELRLITDTMHANAFNYVLTGIPQGTHQVVVEAKATSSAAIFDGDPEGTNTNAAGKAYIGLGSLFVDEVQLINGWGFITQ